MRVHYVQHVPFEGPGAIGDWLRDRSANVTSTRMFEDPRFPDPGEIDWLVVMGGPMSVNDERTCPWLAAEKRFVAETIGASKLVTGVCLGAQLIASALGARVYRNPEREIGWFPVEPVPGSVLPPEPAEVFHWHGETFDLPPGATLLARSGPCENQAFSIGERVVATQFHLETTPEGARDLIDHCPEDLAPGRWVQTAAEMLERPDRFERAHRLLAAVLDRQMAAGDVETAT
jgi:GMP synthase-like glutamine amidotransferase